jgi:hypothetical protein
MTKRSEPITKNRGRNPGERGHWLLEGALIMMVVTVVFVGILDIGLMLFRISFLGERVRSGARYAAVHSYNPTAIQNYVVYNNPTAPTGATTGLFGLTRAMVSVNRYDVGTPSDRIEISISNYPLAFFSPYIARTFTSRNFRASVAVESLGSTD